MRYLMIFYLFLNVDSFGQIDIKKQTIEFYHSLNRGDREFIEPFFHQDALVNFEKNDTLLTWDLEQFLSVCDTYKSSYFEQEVLDVFVLESGFERAIVKVDYQFYIDGNFSHNGVGWIYWSTKNDTLKIENIYDPHFLKNENNTLVEPFSVQKLNQLMDKWHLDVSTLNAVAYFDFMADSFVFLGTDPAERWDKEEFLVYAMPHFEAGKTWTFTKNWRNWYFSEDGKTVWFEESLQTQMEECRGSGVLIYQDNRWKIAHYNLSVVIENDKMKKFIKLRKKR